MAHITAKIISFCTSSFAFGKTSVHIYITKINDVNIKVFFPLFFTPVLSFIQHKSSETIIKEQKEIPVSYTHLRAHET